MKFFFVKIILFIIIIISSDFVTTCKATLYGLFTQVDGVKFNASMSASGSGFTNEIARLNAINSLQDTLQNFINTREPKIVEEDYTIGEYYESVSTIPPDPDKILIHTCIDYRLMNEIVIALNNLGYENLYDQFILAGASLGFNYGTVDSSLVPLPNNYWQQTFYDTVDIAIQLHKIKQIFLIDHCDCGAYEAFYNVEFDNCNNSESLQRHHDNLSMAASTITEKYKDTYGTGDGIKVRKFIMQLDGTMIEIP